MAHQSISVFILIRGVEATSLQCITHVCQVASDGQLLSQYFPIVSFLFVSESLSCKCNTNPMCLCTPKHTNPILISKFNIFRFNYSRWNASIIELECESPQFVVVEVVDNNIDFNEFNNVIDIEFDWLQAINVCGNTRRCSIVEHTC